MDFDFDKNEGKDSASILTQIKSNIIDDSVQDPLAIWEQICSEVGKHNRNSGTITKETLPKNLVQRFYQKTETALNWRVPGFDVQNFVQNGNYLEKILEKCRGKKDETITVPVVGLGGVGKTYLLLRAISILSKDFSFVIWFNAQNAKELEEQFFEFSKERKIYFEDGLSVDGKLDIIKNWFIKNSNFLLVFDNADSYSTLRSFIPMQRGCVLITSTNAAGGWKNSIEIDPMCDEDAVNLLRKESGIHKLNVQDPQALELTKVLLGNLPLAIGQAGAHMNAQSMSLEKYIENYKSTKKRMLEDKSLQSIRNEHIPVYITFEVSFGNIQSEVAKNLLTYCAYLNPDNIPRSLLQNCDFRLRNFLDFGDQIAALKKFSLVKANDYFLNIHCVVQAVIREKMASENTHFEWIKKTLNLLNGSFRYIRNDRNALENAKLLMPHMVRAKEIIKEKNRQDVFQPEFGELLYKIDVFYLDYLYDARGAQECFEEAESLLEGNALLKRNDRYLLKCYAKNKVTEKAQEYACKFNVRTEEDVDILCILGNYHLHSRNNSDFEMVKSCFNRALEISKKSSDTEKIAMILHYLGTTFRLESMKVRNVIKASENKGYDKKWIQEREGELTDCLNFSKDNYKESLVLKRKVYDENHPEIARTVHQLGNLLLDKSEFGLAKSHFNDALNCLKLFHGDEPRKDIGDVLFHLGCAGLALGELEEAEKHLNNSKSMLEKIKSRIDVEDLLLKVNRTISDLVVRKSSQITNFFKNNSTTSSNSCSSNTKKRQEESQATLSNSQLTPYKKYKESQNDGSAGNQEFNHNVNPNDNIRTLRSEKKNTAVIFENEDEPLYEYIKLK